MKAKELIRAHKGCEEAIEWAVEKTVQEAWDTCQRGDWMLWIYNKCYPDNIRELTLAKAYCANTVRHLMKDQRSINAIDIAIKYGMGLASYKELKDSYYSAAAADAYAAYAHAAAASISSSASAGSAAASAAYAAVSAAVYASAIARAAYTGISISSYAAAAYDDAKIENELKTADICRKYLQFNI